MQDIAKAFKALGDESRLRIITALRRRSYCVCELAAAVGLAQPTLSHHLKILRETGLVYGERDGQLTHCSLNKGAFEALGIDLERLLCRCVAVSAVSDHPARPAAALDSASSPGYESRVPRD